MPVELLIVSDSLFISDVRGNKMHHFDLNGNFIRCVASNKGVPRKTQLVDNNIYLAFFNKFSREHQNNRELRVIENNLSFVDAAFNPVEVLKKIRVESDKGYLKYVDEELFVANIYDSLNKILYISDNRDDRYRIEVMSLKGDKQVLYSIKKNYRKIPYTLQEKNNIRPMFYGPGDAYDKHNDGSQIPKFKKAVNNLYLDNQSRLWVQTSSAEGSMQYDIFNGEQLLSSIDFKELGNDDEILFKNDCLYSFNRDSMTVKVFKY